MNRPLILLNFKTYPESSGKKAFKMASDLAKVKTKRYHIAIAPSTLTLKDIAEEVNLDVFAQHADPVGLGAHTGSVSPEELKNLGVKGVILNHSEHKLKPEVVSKTIKLCRQNKLAVIGCVSNLEEVKLWAKYMPSFIAYEPQELIGGKISVTSVKPEIILKAVELVKKLSPQTGVLAGAGVHSRNDLAQALFIEYFPKIHGDFWRVFYKLWLN